jgi:hypothetical protein
MLARAGSDRQHENRRLGLSDAEEDAIVSLMQTLTDGFTPSTIKSRPRRGQA